MKKLHVELGCDGYDITIGGGLLADAAKMFDLNRKILVLTDDGVPENYAEKIKESASYAEILTLPAGEGTKSLIALEKVLTKMAY